MVVNELSAELVESYNALISLLPPMFQTFLNLFLLVVLIVIYCVFVWKFYRFIGTRNIFEFDLNKHNKATHPLLVKLITGGFYLLEYIIILPFLIFFWFAIYTFFLIFLIEEAATVKIILLISAVSIAAIRMATYIPNYGENLAKDLAKILPFTLLATAVLTPTFFMKDFITMILLRFSDLSILFGEISNYLIFVFILETLLRMFEFVFGLFGLEDPIEEDKDD